MAATAARTDVDAWVDVCTRSDCSVSSQRARTPLPSNGIDALRSISRSSSSVCGAACSARSTAERVGVRALDEMRRDVVGHVGVDGSVGPTGGVDPHHGFEELVRHLDGLAGVLRDVPVDRHHHHHGFADVVHLVLGERVRRPRCVQGRVRDEQRQRLADSSALCCIGVGEVVVGVDGDDALDVERAGDVDVEHPRVGVRAADERRGQRAAPQVVEVAAATREQPRVLDPGDPLAEELRGHERASACSRRSSAARSTAFLMFW